MHLFFPHWTAQRRKLPVHARPNLEFLEQRDCPSAPPSITSLISTQLSGNLTQVSGYVTDPNPAGVTVSFQGAVTGQASANANGYFAFESLGFTPGPLTAQAVDGAGLTSNPVVVNVAGFAPQVSVSVAYNANGTATLSGLVTDPHPGGLQVVFNGVLSGSAQTTANGAFSLTTLVPTTGQVTVTTTDPYYQSSTPVAVQVDGPAPVVTSFQSTALANGSWTFSGQVLDRNPTSVQISFGGLNSLQGKTISVAANGTFSLTTLLQPGEAGQASVKASNGTGLGSNTATAFTANTPGLTLNITNEEAKTVLLTGQVTDPNPGGLTVTFTGVATGSVVTKADGSFSVQLQATSLGTIQGVVVNTSGVASKPAVVTVASPPPVITALNANDEAGVWVFTGSVTGPWVDGLTVSFSGLPEVANEAVTVGANGGFSLVVSIDPEEDGTVNATTMDVWGQSSNTASWLVRQSS